MVTDMKLLHTIEAADVGMGVYRHSMNSPERHTLVAIKQTFGGILKCDIGRKVWMDSQGRLKLDGPVITK